MGAKKIKPLINWLLRLLAFSLWGICIVSSDCNRTISSPALITSPEYQFHMKGTYLFCTIEIRTPYSLEGRVIEIQFLRFRLGDLMKGDCINGHMTIYDGDARKVRQEFGRYCGELEQIYTYYAENSKVDIVFIADSFNDLIEYELNVRWVEKRALPERFGPRPDLYPHRRGNLVEGTFCERVFQDCSRLQSCYVQSPGYPGIYPRNLKCRYYLNTKHPYIKLYVDQSRANPLLFNVAGQECDSLITCPFHYLGEESECEKDYVKIYDGVDEFSPLIGTFCGIGHFPSSIIGTGNTLFLEFFTSPDGPFLNTGFDLRVGHLPGNLAKYEDGTCHRIFRSEDLDSKEKTEGIFLSLEHWYPPNTNCTYLIEGRKHEIVRLYFPSFRVNRIQNPLMNSKGDCRESLTVYNSNFAEGSQVMKTFCDSYSRPLEKFDFVSTGNALYVNFISTTGSYSGSSLEFWAQYDFFDNRHDGVLREGTICDEYFIGNDEGTFRSPRNTLIYKDLQKELKCRYDIFSDSRKFGRILFEFESLRLVRREKIKCEINCVNNTEVDRLTLTDPYRNNYALSCISNCSDVSPLSKVGQQYLSRGPQLTLEMFIEKSGALLNYFKSTKALFEAKYKYVHPFQCGPSMIGINERSASGILTFPREGDKNIKNLKEDLWCIWDLDLQRGPQDLQLAFHNVTFQSKSCSSISVEIRLPGSEEVFYRQCGPISAKNVPQTLPDLSRRNFLIHPFVQVHFRMKPKERGYFQLEWKVPALIQKSN